MNPRRKEMIHALLASTFLTAAMFLIAISLRGDGLSIASGLLGAFGLTNCALVIFLDSRDE